jgi:hypothetical protein
VESILLEKRQKMDSPTPSGVEPKISICTTYRGEVRDLMADGKSHVRTLMIETRNRHLTHFVGTGHAPRSFSHLLDGGKQHSNQDSDDCNDDK